MVSGNSSVPEASACAESGTPLCKMLARPNPLAFLSTGELLGKHSLTAKQRTSLPSNMTPETPLKRERSKFVMPANITPFGLSPRHIIAASATSPRVNAASKHGPMTPSNLGTKVRQSIDGQDSLAESDVESLIDATRHHMSPAPPMEDDVWVSSFSDKSCNAIDSPFVDCVRPIAGDHVDGNCGLENRFGEQDALYSSVSSHTTSPDMLVEEEDIFCSSDNEDPFVCTTQDMERYANTLSTLETASKSAEYPSNPAWRSDYPRFFTHDYFYASNWIEDSGVDAGALYGIKSDFKRPPTCVGVYPSHACCEVSHGSSASQCEHCHNQLYQQCLSLASDSQKFDSCNSFQTECVQKSCSLPTGHDGTTLDLAQTVNCSQSFDVFQSSDSQLCSNEHVYLHSDSCQTQSPDPCNDDSRLFCCCFHSLDTKGFLQATDEFHKCQLPKKSRKRACIDKEINSTCNSASQSSTRGDLNSSQSAQFFARSCSSQSTSLTASCICPSHTVDMFERHFDVIGELGNGSFSDVFRVVRRVDGHSFALKRSRAPFTGMTDMRRRLQEVEALWIARDCPNCLQIVASWEHRGHLYILTELCEHGSLANVIEYMAATGARFSEHQVWQILKQIATGLAHLHNAGVAHLDLKPANILVSSDGTLKLGDFGLSLRTGAVSTHDPDAQGDKYYMAPETLEGIYGCAADLFSLGLLVIELLANIDLPSCGPSWQKLRHADYSEIPFEGVSQAMRQLICKMTHPEPSFRPTVNSVLSCVDKALESEHD